MEGTYDVTLGGQTIGEVQLKREGLYYRITCRCRRGDRDIHRLYADGEKLGVLIPEREELVLHTKVAAKRLKEGCAFTLDGQAKTFTTIRPAEPFEHLDKVRYGSLAYRDGIPGLVLDT